MNVEEAVHPSDDLTNDDNSIIKDHESQQERINWNNSFYTLVENELKPSTQLEDQNKNNDKKSTNKHRGELVMT